MNVRSEVIIEIVKNERTYRFSMPVGATFNECSEVALQVVQDIAELAKVSEEQAKQREADKTSGVQGE